MADMKKVYDHLMIINLYCKEDKRFKKALSNTLRSSFCFSLWDYETHS